MWKEATNKGRKERKWDGGKVGGEAMRGKKKRTKKKRPHSARLYLTKEKEITKQPM